MTMHGTSNTLEHNYYIVQLRHSHDPELVMLTRAVFPVLTSIIDSRPFPPPLPRPVAGPPSSCSSPESSPPEPQPPPPPTVESGVSADPDDAEDLEYSMESGRCHRSGSYQTSSV